VNFVHLVNKLRLEASQFALSGHTIHENHRHTGMVEMLNTFQQAPHAMLPTATADEASRQEFSKSLKQFIQKGLLPGLSPIYKTRAVDRYVKETGKAPTPDRHGIRKAMVRDAYFQHYAAVNRISQELLWDSVIDSIERQEADLAEAAMACSAKNKGQLLIPDTFDVPKYVAALDIHCMPGGYPGEEKPEEINGGVLYDRGVYLYSMGYTGPNNDDMGRSVCNYIKRRLNGFTPRRILDMGCTVGHSTLPYKELFPDAEVWGVDVAAQQVRYAHARAGAFGLDVNFAQMNAEKTSFPDGHFDLVVSHILLHETSGKAMPRIFEECFRVLAPGGVMIHADLPPFDLMDPFTQFILDNETYYNNEPFWGAMREVDQVGLARKVGFVPDSVRFDTAPMAVMEFAAQAAGYSQEAAEGVADRDFVAGEFAPGGGWEVLIAQKPA
jgi:ubiquinone/menaquinone biosynthesis C-methylase UbiE